MSSKVLPVPCIIQVQHYKYNPYSIVQATKQSKLGPSLSPMFDINGMAMLGMPLPLTSSKPE